MSDKAITRTYKLAKVQTPYVKSITIHSTLDVITMTIEWNEDTTEAEKRQVRNMAIALGMTVEEE